MPLLCSECLPLYRCWGLPRRSDLRLAVGCRNWFKTVDFGVPQLWLYAAGDPLCDCAQLEHLIAARKARCSTCCMCLKYAAAAVMLVMHLVPRPALPEVNITGIFPVKGCHRHLLDQETTRLVCVCPDRTKADMLLLVQGRCDTDASMARLGACGALQALPCTVHCRAEQFSWSGCWRWQSKRRS